MLNPNQQNYLVWLRTNYPELYNQYAAPVLNRQLGDDTADSSDNSIFSSILDTISAVIPSLATVYTASQTQKLAQQTAIARANTPKTGLASISTTTWLIGGGILLGGLLLLRR